MKNKKVSNGLYFASNFYEIKTWLIELNDGKFLLLRKIFFNVHEGKKPSRGSKKFKKMVFLDLTVNFQKLFKLVH